MYFWIFNEESLKNHRAIDFFIIVSYHWFSESTDYRLITYQIDREDLLFFHFYKICYFIVIKLNSDNDLCFSVKIRFILQNDLSVQLSFNNHWLKW